MLELKSWHHGEALKQQPRRHELVAAEHQLIAPVSWSRLPKRNLAITGPPPPHPRPFWLAGPTNPVVLATLNRPPSGGS